MDKTPDNESEFQIILKHDTPFRLSGNKAIYEYVQFENHAKSARIKWKVMQYKTPFARVLFKEQTIPLNIIRNTVWLNSDIMHSDGTLYNKTFQPFGTESQLPIVPLDPTKQYNTTDVVGIEHTHMLLHEPHTSEEISENSHYHARQSRHLYWIKQQSAYRYSNLNESVKGGHIVSTVVNTRAVAPFLYTAGETGVPVNLNYVCLIDMHVKEFSGPVSKLEDHLNQSVPKSLEIIPVSRYYKSKTVKRRRLDYGKTAGVTKVFVNHSTWDTPLADESQLGATNYVKDYDSIGGREVYLHKEYIKPLRFQWNEVDQCMDVYAREHLHSFDGIAAFGDLDADSSPIDGIYPMLIDNFNRFRKTDREPDCVVPTHGYTEWKYTKSLVDNLTAQGVPEYEYEFVTPVASATDEELAIVTQREHEVKYDFIRPALVKLAQNDEHGTQNILIGVGTGEVKFERTYNLSDGNREELKRSAFTSVKKYGKHACETQKFREQLICRSAVITPEFDEQSDITVSIGGYATNQKRIQPSEGYQSGYDIPTGYLASEDSVTNTNPAKTWVNQTVRRADKFEITLEWDKDGPDMSNCLKKRGFIIEISVKMM